MEIVNRIKDGLHQDNNVYDQPNYTMRDNINGVISDLGNGYYKWSNIKGNVFSFSIQPADKYMAHCLIRDRLFIIALNETSNLFKIFEITLVNNLGTANLIWSTSNSNMNMSFEHPIRSIFGFYENEETQRIYFTDYYNQPRVINIGKAGDPVVVDEKFLEFFPVLDRVYGFISRVTIETGGAVKAGSYFFAWRFYTDDGYFTDWSALSNPVITTRNLPGSTYESYQAYEGRQPNEVTDNKIVVRIEDIDTDYENMQVCAFYSNDMNIAEPAVIFYDGLITGIDMDITFIGTENAGTVSMDDLVETSIKVDLIKDMTPAKKQNVIACIKERPDLDIPSSLNASVEVGIYHIPLDTSSYLNRMSSGGDVKSLVSLWSSDYLESHDILIPGQWYYAETNVEYRNDGLSPSINVAQGNVFKVSETATNPTLLSGTERMAVVRKKYLLAGGDPNGDINSNFAFEYELLNGEFPDWKSQKVTRNLKSYPMGETIRLGVLFFDKTGRPFLIRHLYNTNILTGLCDPNIPKRSYANPLLHLCYPHGAADSLYYDYALARLQHLIVSDLDITDVADQIGGFMIVRSPIIHQYVGMGLLNSTFLNEPDHPHDIHAYPGFFFYDWPTMQHHRGCYQFYCPEDIFNQKDFTIQSGDRIENIMYLWPYVANEAPVVGGHTFWGYGRRESNDYDFYQKFYIPATVFPTVNGTIGVDHEIVNVTQYILGTDDLPIDPLDSTKLFRIHSARAESAIIGVVGHVGYNSNCSILMIDVNDTSDNIIGATAIDDWPNALLCALKRPTVDPYGGANESSYANTLYMSTGHYQEINDTVLASVLSGGRYVFNNIDIFGGDTYVQLFDLKRLYGNYDSGDRFGHSVIFPVESRMNIGMRQGNHIAKLRSYDSDYNTSGLKYETGAFVLEEFNYNDGYSSDNINDLYIPVPFKYKNLTDLISRIRYSPEKNYGEIRDSFRRFLPNDFIDIDVNKGAITNIKYKNNRLIYWQPDEIGYIPLQERALTQNSIGQPVQLGIGGLFERYDQLIDRIGNSHQFGLVESPLGFHWYDSRRKIYLSIGFNLQVSQESLIKGIDKFFNENIIDDLDTKDNPFSATPQGVIGGYDPMTKMIFSTFIIPSGGSTTRHTIGIHSLINKFIGKYNIYPFAYMTVKNHMFHVQNEGLNFYIHGTGQYSNFFGTQYQALVTIVVKEETNLVKLFDTFEMIGNENLFNSITYENSSQQITEIIAEYYPLSVLNRNYKFLKRRWFGNFPRISRERLSDGYLKITFMMDYPYLVELYDFKSNVRKIY